MLRVGNVDKGMFEIPYPVSFEKSTDGFNDSDETILGYKRFKDKAYKSMSLNATWKLPTVEAAKLQNTLESISDTLVLDSIMDSSTRVPHGARDAEFIARSILFSYLDATTAVDRISDTVCQVYFSRGFTSLPKDTVLKSPTFRMILGKDFTDIIAGSDFEVDYDNELYCNMSLHVYAGTEYVSTYTFEDSFSGSLAIDNIFTDLPQATHIMVEYYFYIDISTLNHLSNYITAKTPLAVKDINNIDKNFVDTLSTSYRITGTTSNNYISANGAGLSEVSYTFEEVLH